MKSENVVKLKGLLKSNASNTNQGILLTEKQGNLKECVTSLFKSIADRNETRELVEQTLLETELLYQDKRSNGVRQKNRRMLKISFEDCYEGSTLAIKGKVGEVTCTIEAKKKTVKVSKELKAIQLLMKSLPNKFNKTHLGWVESAITEAKATKQATAEQREKARLQAQRDRLGIQVKECFQMFKAVGITPSGEQLLEVAADKMYKKQMNA